MKIRIKGDSLRLRLSQDEVDSFQQYGRVADQIRFGSDESEMLTYELVRSSGHSSVSAEFSGAEISVYVPRATADGWTDSEEVGFEGNQPTAGNQSLHILVEKDFQCLHKRPNEDESQLYPNPQASEETA